ncbi:hypothetical protein ACFIQG_19970 [Comamonas odontotermitis]|uniref:hypothetical protein n=1 Tax=Comamonas odontotermitis TaxID=379895 RepID=UPI0036705D00
MKKTWIATAFVLLSSAAVAQVEEHSSTSSRTNERQTTNSSAISTNRSISPGSLFFDHLSELERVIQQNVEYSNDRATMREKISEVQFKFLDMKYAQGKFKPRDVNNPRFATAHYCNLFSTQNRAVWTHDPETSQTRSVYDNGKITFQESDYVKQLSDTSTSNEMSEKMLGKPIKAGESIRCAAFYADLIDHAIATLEKKGATKGKTIYVKDLQKEAELAIWDAFSYEPQNQYTVLPSQSQCFLPTAENIRKGGGKQFRCEQWEMTISPISVVKSGIVILDSNTINGKTWQFVDSQTSTNSNSSKNSSTRSRSQKANVAN